MPQSALFQALWLYWGHSSGLGVESLPATLELTVTWGAWVRISHCRGEFGKERTDVALEAPCPPST